MDLSDTYNQLLQEHLVLVRHIARLTKLLRAARQFLVGARQQAGLVCLHFDSPDARVEFARIDHLLQTIDRELNR